MASGRRVGSGRWLLLAALLTAAGANAGSGMFKSVSEEEGDPEVSLGSEYETLEGVVARSGNTPVKIEAVANERFLCTKDKSPVNDKWPLVSWSHDMAWSDVTGARTLEIVLGPTHDGDTESAPLQGAAITEVYQALHAEAKKGCDKSLSSDFCFVSVAAVQKALGNKLTTVCGQSGDPFYAQSKEGYDPKEVGFLLSSKGKHTVDESSVWTQTTLGFTADSLIEVDGAKLFGRSWDGIGSMKQKSTVTVYSKDRLKLFDDIQEATSKAFSAKSPARQSQILYAVYAILSHLANEAAFDKSDLYKSQPFHHPDWKNGYILYPKTSVVAIVESLSKDDEITARSVFKGVVSKVAGSIKQKAFKALWQDASKLDQAKASKSLKFLLLEIRAPQEKAFKVTGSGEKMVVQIPPLSL